MNEERKNDPDEKARNDKHVHWHMHASTRKGLSVDWVSKCDIRKKSSFTEQQRLLNVRENSWSAHATKT